MTRIDFYSLSPESKKNRFDLTCKLIQRIRAQELRVLIYCLDSSLAERIDKLLWTFQADSFIPHGRVGYTDLNLTPVLISADGNPQSENQVLINLTLEKPIFLDRFDRLCELIDHDPAIRAAGRERFQIYRNEGYPLAHHEIKL